MKIWLNTVWHFCNLTVGECDNDILKVTHKIVLWQCENMTLTMTLWEYEKE